MKKIIITVAILILVVILYINLSFKSPAIIVANRKPATDFYTKLAYAGEDIVDPNIAYKAAYIQIKYPGGDIPANTGVCSDVIIRTYRKVGIDLQVKVHEDMKNNFNIYPKQWGLTHTDTNIDHRRVYNLNTFFKRKGQTLPITKISSDYKPGEIVIWRLMNGLPHIGLVTSVKALSGNYYMVHNWGSGQVMEDVLFCSEIIGHYRYK
ncbi:MAG: DUF1287 domain-containing protein [bacterium]